MSVEDKTYIAKEVEHRRIATSPIDITTVLLYKEDEAVMLGPSPAEISPAKSIKFDEAEDGDHH